MKILLLTLVLISGSAIADKNLADDQSFSCTAINDSTMTIPLYDDIFVIEVSKHGLSKIKYKRKYQGRDTYGPLYTIRGCWHAKQVEASPNSSISVECLEDGQEGMFSINTKSMVGDLYFYYPKIGYPERSGFYVQCKNI